MYICTRAEHILIIWGPFSDDLFSHPVEGGGGVDFPLNVMI
jgi:hypothetical protein